MPHETWKTFSAKQLKAGKNLKEAGIAWKKHKKNRGGSPNGGTMPDRTTTTTGGRTFTFKFKGRPAIELDKSVTYDIARGVVQALRKGATTRDDGFRAQAAQVLLEAKGDTPEADSIETEFGEMVGEIMKYVLANEGVTASEWAGLYPKEMTDESGIFGAAGELFDDLFGADARPSAGDVGSFLGAAGAAAALGL